MTIALNTTLGEPKIGSILLIDPSKMFSKMLQRALETLGYPVRQVSTLHTAIELLTFFSFELIIVDLTLPDGEGEMILQNLHIFEKHKIFI